MEIKHLFVALFLLCAQLSCCQCKSSDIDLGSSTSEDSLDVRDEPQIFKGIGHVRGSLKEKYGKPLNTSVKNALRKGASALNEGRGGSPPIDNIRGNDLRDNTFYKAAKVPTELNTAELEAAYAKRVREREDELEKSIVKHDQEVSALREQILREKTKLLGKTKDEKGNLMDNTGPGPAYLPSIDFSSR